MSTQPINDGGPAVVITLKGGGTALVSPVDAERVMAHQWRLSGGGYVYLVGGKVAGRECLLHRIVMQPEEGHEIHHRNEIKTDCRRGNLVALSPSEHQKFHSHIVIERNRASRIYALVATCKVCGIEFTKHRDHRGRQTCCSKRCACLAAVAARKEAAHGLR